MPALSSCSHWGPGPGLELLFCKTKPTPPLPLSLPFPASPAGFQPSDSSDFQTQLSGHPGLRERWVGAQRRPTDPGDGSSLLELQAPVELSTGHSHSGMNAAQASKNLFFFLFPTENLIASIDWSDFKNFTLYGGCPGAGLRQTLNPQPSTRRSGAPGGEPSSEPTGASGATFSQPFLRTCITEEPHHPGTVSAFGIESPRVWPRFGKSIRSTGPWGPEELR